MILLFLLLQAHSFFTYGSGDINFSKIGIEEGLSQLSVMTIYQDELGNMWFGTREGLNVYNGTTIRTLQSNESSENSLSGNLINAIDGDMKGSIFIHTQNGIDKFDIKTGTISPLVRIRVNAMNYGNGKLWYAMHNVVYMYDNGENHSFCKIEDSDQITTLLPTSDNRLLVGTISAGVYEIDRNKRAHKILHDCSRVSSIFEDSKQNIWVTTWDNGLYKIDTDKDIVNYRQDRKNPAKGLSSDFTRIVCEDDDANIWIGTKLGLDKLDTEQSLFYHYGSEAYDDRGLSNESVWALYKDNYANIWIGTYFGGVNYFDPKSNIYTFHNLEKGIFSNKPFPIISEIIPYRDNMLFLCSEGNGLIIYNKEDKTYTDIDKLKNDNIKTAYYDKEEGKLYLGLHLGGLIVLNPETWSLKEYREIRPELAESNIVRKILPYEGNYLIATYNGLYLFDKESATFSVFSEELHRYASYFVDIVIDNTNNLWVASRGLYKYNIDTKETRLFFHDPNDKQTLSNNNISKLYIDSKERLWIGTSGGGVNLFHDNTSTFTRFTSENSNLRNNYVSNIRESPLGSIYLTTTQGLSSLNPSNREVINFVFDEGIPLNSLFNGGITIKSDGEIYVAGMNGMVSFHEQHILKDLQPVHLYFSELWVNNREVTPHDDTKLLDNILPFTEKLKFNHTQSALTFRFSSNNIAAHNRYQYLYRLKRHSHEWIPLREGLYEINLMNLDPGKYQLDLKAISPGSKTVLGNSSISFWVTPPFYRSIIAYIIYVLTAFTLIWLYIRYVKYKVRLESSLLFEKKQKQHIEEVNHLKLRFFTNISHEFRTPLTLITSQIDLLKRDEKLSTAAQSKVSDIARNTSLMKNLINELLDFRKIDNGKLVIKAGEYNIVQFIHEIYLAFEEYAKEKQIDFSFVSPDGTILAWFDQNQLQKVFFNLLSNAFKYTANGGKITVYISQNKDMVDISIKDTGTGISQDNIDKVFDRFYQIDNGYESGNISSGTGLGLALSKGIVDAHHGKITLESKLDEGSNFKVSLLKGTAHFSDNERLISESADVISIKNIKEYLPEITAIKEQPFNIHDDNQKNRILIVEDNIELLSVLRSVFEPTYEVIIATNGEEGLTKTIENQPDIVVSDLMMPIMSGSEMCLKIKSNFTVCHIPVVLLTAQTAVESSIESLKLGADDYITKPFDVSMLLMRCNNLVKGRKVLQEKFAKSTNISSSAIASNKMDLEFLEKANSVIEQNIENPDFGVNEFSQEMNMGRTSLFNKIKGVTGQTPNDFIITIKMKKASSLLVNHPELNISDITYRLGFNSPKYFSKCFKDQFGITPSDYKSMHTAS